MKPSIGRIVMYRLSEMERPLNEGLPAGAAIITRVHNDTCVNLKVFLDQSSATLFRTSVVQGADTGQWSWPERV